MFCFSVYRGSSLTNYWLSQIITPLPTLPDPRLIFLFFLLFLGPWLLGCWICSIWSLPFLTFLSFVLHLLLCVLGDFFASVLQNANPVIQLWKRAPCWACCPWVEDLDSRLSPGDVWVQGRDLGKCAIAKTLHSLWRILMYVINSQGCLPVFLLCTDFQNFFFIYDFF